MSVSQCNRNKKKKKQMGPNQMYKLLHSKGNHKQNEKATYGSEKILTNFVTNKCFIAKIYKELI